MGPFVWRPGPVSLPRVARLLDRASNRQRRLFACACCRWTWDAVPPGPLRKLVAAAERHADGEVGPGLLGVVRRHAASAMPGPSGHAPVRRAVMAAGSGDPADALEAAAVVAAAAVGPAVTAVVEGREVSGEAAADAAAAWAAVWRQSRGGGWDDSWNRIRNDAREAADRAARDAVEGQLLRLLQDIMSIPAGFGRFDPSWRAPTVVALAKAMYKARDFGAMPVLADALEEAGCDDPGVLNHCRGVQDHVKGCWLIDAIMNNG